MQEFSTTHRVAHSAEEMFNLVADVERYPEFVPLCQALVVRERKKQDEGKEVIVADMTVAYKFLHETFTSRVLLDRAGNRVLVEHVEGPFKHLENRWRFAPVDGTSCDVSFYVAYQFSSRSMQLLAGAVFDRAFRKFVAAFEQRADEVHGTGASRNASGVAASSGS